MISQRSDTEKNHLIEDGKKIGIDKIIKRNEIINNSLKSKIWNNVIPLFKVWKNTENINPRVSKTSNGKTMFLSKCAICDSKK